MSNPDTFIGKKETATLESFKKFKALLGAMSIISLFVFIIAVFLTVPQFFAYFWLIIPLFLTLLFTKTFGAYEAYTKMRQQTDVMQLQLIEMNNQVLDLQTKQDSESSGTTNEQ